MAITIGHGTRVLFTGDSITDAGRRAGAGDGLGDGYVRRLADSPAFEGVDVVNTGIGGDRVADLLARLSDDVLAHRPDVLSILIGINDTWRRYDDHDETSVQDFTERYRAVLTAARDAGFALVLIEPFLLPVLRAQKTWREDLDPKIDAVRALAIEFDAVLVPADTELSRLAAERGAPELAEDGVHPTPEGHDVLAALWLDTVLGTDDEGATS